MKPAHLGDIKSHQSLVSFVIGISMVLTAFLLVDIAIVTLATSLPKQGALNVLRGAHWLWLLPGIALGWATWKVGWQATFSGMFGALLGYVAVLNSRGMWIWPSTFDRYWDNDLRWRTTLMAGLLAFGLLSLAASYRRAHVVWSVDKQQRLANRACWIFCGTLLAYGITSIYSPVESVFPALRPIYIGVLAVVLVVGCWMANLKKDECT